MARPRSCCRISYKFIYPFFRSVLRSYFTCEPIWQPYLHLWANPSLLLRTNSWVGIEFFSSRPYFHWENCFAITVSCYFLWCHLHLEKNSYRKEASKPSSTSVHPSHHLIWYGLYPNYLFVSNSIREPAKSIMFTGQCRPLKRSISSNSKLAAGQNIQLHGNWKLL